MGAYFAYRMYKVRKVYKTVKGVKKIKTVHKTKRVKVYKRVQLKASVIAPKIHSMPRIGTALEKSDAHHRMASYLTVKQLSKGRVYTSRNRMGQIFTHLKVRALYKGREGVVHYIITKDGEINHQLWTKGTSSYLSNFIL
ncbi:hypothetical protein KZO01_26280 [Kurthia zopfii]|uniref:Uncharacterized protein n=2 Tax=Kurthia zopfii TaxID=1650 RepID=A0A8B4QAB3_9BACL|nr:hypothetical protein [Kurthia zopfii]TDR32614.1 hypothetical protein DFR61_1623 [Kurthia zopfii]GEK32319.1 hypothetical protein KZO01_26280 [Kurthia zopfii]STX09656.1 Uncharacterised protein [Kurthia zopfii]